MSLNTRTERTIDLGAQEYLVSFSRYDGSICVSNSSEVGHSNADVINVRSSGDALRKAVVAYIRDAKWAAGDSVPEVMQFLREAVEKATEAYAHLESTHPEHAQASLPETEVIA